MLTVPVSGVSLSFTFKDAGKYDFLCEQHSNMTGTVDATPRWAGCAGPAADPHSSTSGTVRAV